MFTLISRLEQSFFGNSDKITSAGLVELQLRLQRKVPMILFWENKRYFHLFWTLSAKNYPTFDEVFWRACQKCTLGFPGNNFWENSFWRRMNFFIVFLFFSEHISDCRQKRFGIVKNAIWVSRRIFLGQTSFEKNICSLWSFLDFEPLFWNPDEHMSVRLS